MAVVFLDPRFPAMIPVEAVSVLGGDVCYTEEVPVHVRWVIADLGGHTLMDTQILVTTDVANPAVRQRLDRGEQMITAPSLKVDLHNQLEAGDSAGTGSAGRAELPPAPMPGAQVVDAGVENAQVPASVMEEIEQAVVLMARALRQGEWEQSMTHASLMDYLREETQELAQIVEQIDSHTDIPEQLEEELCKELADVFLQVLFHAEIANRRGAFDIGHVAGAFVDKMHLRAPYLFEDEERFVPRAEQQRLWAEGKKKQRNENEGG